MADFPALPIWTDAYLADTAARISAEEHGVYQLLMQLAWREGNETRLPTEDDCVLWIKGVCRDMHGRPAKRIVRAILDRYWRQDGNGLWYQKRLEKEWKHVRNTSETRSKSAQKRWAQSKDNKGIADANAYARARVPHPHPHPVETQSPSESQNLNHTSTGRNGSVPPDGGYRFEGKIIRLNHEHYETWKKRYHAIPDFDCHLGVLDEWYDRNLELGERKKWFNRACNALAKKHQEIIAERVPASTGYVRSKGLLG